MNDDYTQEQIDAMTRDQMVDALRARGDALSLAVADTLVYLLNIDALYENACTRIARVTHELEETKRPLDAQMARLNAQVITLNERIDQLESKPQPGGEVSPTTPKEKAR